MELSTALGRISISSDAIAQIVARTVSESYGVVAMAGPKWLPSRSTEGWKRRRPSRRRPAERLGRLGRPWGIEVRRDGDAVTVDIHVVVEYGLNLAEVASSVRNRVGYELERLTGLPVRSVEVHVDDVREP
jgi:uncharacterized alkaline shock family protein YloU